MFDWSMPVEHHGLYGETLVEQLPAPAFTAAIIFSLSFLIVCNVDSRRLSTLQTAAVDSSLSYLLRISIFCSRVIDFLAYFLPGTSFSLDHALGP